MLEFYRHTSMKDLFGYFSFFRFCSQLCHWGSGIQSPKTTVYIYKMRKIEPDILNYFPTLKTYISCIVYFLYFLNTIHVLNYDNSTLKEFKYIIISRFFCIRRNKSWTLTWPSVPQSPPQVIPRDVFSPKQTLHSLGDQPNLLNKPLLTCI